VREWSCVTVNLNGANRENEWNLITEIFNSTSTTKVPDRQGSEKFKPSSTRTNYGTMTVTGSSINPNPRPEKKSLIEYRTHE
jgi:hypothetical protein